MSKKKSPPVVCGFLTFSRMVEKPFESLGCIFNQFLHAYLSTLDYKFLFIYLQL